MFYVTIIYITANWTTDCCLIHTGLMHQHWTNNEQLYKIPATFYEWIQPTIYVS